MSPSDKPEEEKALEALARHGEPVLPSVREIIKDLDACSKLAPYFEFAKRIVEDQMDENMKRALGLMKEKK